jgi:hypothetical protein
MLAPTHKYKKQYGTLLRGDELHFFWTERKKLQTYWTRVERLQDTKSNRELVDMEWQGGQVRGGGVELGQLVFKTTVRLQPNFASDIGKKEKTNDKTE